MGRLLKPGEAPNNYSDEEEEATSTETSEKLKDEWILCVYGLRSTVLTKYDSLLQVIPISKL